MLPLISDQGRLTEGDGRLGTVDLLVKLALFCIEEEKYILSIKSS